jgi:hypothetical protein
MNVHKDLVIAYGRLEKEVQSCMAAQCREECARCLSPCCRIDFCRESLESAFLRHVRKHFAPRVRWDPSLGWLTPRGCALPAGRPPVCYEFLCRVLEERQPTRPHREALLTLARMIAQVGTSVGGNCHLVELDDLTRLSRKRLTFRLEQAHNVLDGLRLFWQNGNSNPKQPTVSPHPPIRAAAPPEHRPGSICRHTNRSVGRCRG